MADARLAAWEETGYAGTWVETAVDVGSGILREAAIGVATGGVGTAVRFAGAGVRAATWAQRGASAALFVRDLYEGSSQIAVGIDQINDGDVLGGSLNIFGGAFTIGVGSFVGYRGLTHSLTNTGKATPAHIVDDIAEVPGRTVDAPKIESLSLPILNPHFTPKPGIGTKAILPEEFGLGIKGGITGKPNAALMIDGQVYVHHHHLAAQELAGTVPKPGDLYGFATLDELGNVISVEWITVR